MTPSFKNRIALVLLFKFVAHFRLSASLESPSLYYYNQ